MIRRNRPWARIVLIVVGLLCFPSLACAQTSAAESDSTGTGPIEALPGTAALTAGQLDQLTAPIALYPDPLLGQILTAATYPLEIVLAARWLDAPDRAALSAEAMNAALQQQDWDASVKALLGEPQLLRMLNENLQWTEELGNAFLQQPADVMDSIQRLRQAAASSGALKSTPQQSVSNDDGALVIESASPDVLYVPCYGPVVYGPWPWPAYPPLYLTFPVGFCTPGPFITFGIGFALFGPYWGGYRWHWRAHRLYTTAYGRGRAARPWRFDPVHRRGVPYPNAQTARRYLGPDAQTWRRYRGFPARPTPSPGSRPQPRLAPGNRSQPPARAPMQREWTRPPPMARPADTMRSGPEVFQSYGPGARARSQAARGAASRSSPQSRGGFGARGNAAHRGGRPPR